jgi:hypothetical protein
MHLHTFQELLPQFEQAFLNDLANRALMLLVYYRLYLTQEFMIFLFKAANKSVICRNIQLMRRSSNWSCPLLNALVGASSH